MSTTITILSWNIQSLGASKAAIQPPVAGNVIPPLSKSQIVDFIATTAKQLNIDALGIMEVLGGMGPTLLQWLLSSLNNNGAAGSTWKGLVSSRQDGGTQEEYLFLWKSTANFDLDPNAFPGPSSLIGVADEQAFANFFTSANITTAADKTQFFQALAANKYLIAGTFKLGKGGGMKSTRTYRINPALWQALQNGTAVAFTNNNPAPPVNFSAAQLSQISSILAKLDVLRFISFGDRSPYLINLTLDTKPLTIAIYHAPGPQDITRYVAINIIGLSQTLAVSTPTDKNTLIMGDFNIALNQMAMQGRVYQRAPAPGNANGVVFKEVTPVTRQVIFTPITGGTIQTQAARLPSPTYTSLTNFFVCNGSPITGTYGNTFDNFYYHPSNTAANSLSFVASSAIVALPLTSFITGQTGYSSELSKSLFSFFKILGGETYLDRRIIVIAKLKGDIDDKIEKLETRHDAASTALNNAKAANASTSTLKLRIKKVETEIAKEKAKQSLLKDSVTSVNATKSLLGNALAIQPAGIGDTLTMYRYAISDHLAISIQVQS